MTDNDGLISITEIARTHGRDPAAVRRSLLHRGINVSRRKIGKRPTSYITRADYERVAEEMGAGAQPQHADVVGSGCFYLIQLEPEHDPDRFKVGFSIDSARRVAEHRTAAPFATLVKTWGCKPLWEQTAIDCVTQGCEQLSTEVFRGDLAQVQEWGERFFDLMPEAK